MNWKYIGYITTAMLIGGLFYLVLNSSLFREKDAEAQCVQLSLASCNSPGPCAPTVCGACTFKNQTQVSDGWFVALCECL